MKSIIKKLLDISYGVIIGSVIGILGAVILNLKDVQDRLLLRRSSMDYVSKKTREQSFAYTKRELNQRIFGMCVIILGFVIIILADIFHF
ncbi:MAG: hypothetical protein ACYDAJ_09010 [Nitrosotalea sp.]